MSANELESHSTDLATLPAQTGERRAMGTPRFGARWVQVPLALVLVTALWWPLCWWRLGNAPFYTKGEPREALVVWEMTHGGGWILPRRNGVEIPSKPPMFHWLGALASLAAGQVDEATVRMPSAIASLLGLYAALLAGSYWWSVRAGLASALVLATSFEWARAATNARVDMVLTLGLEVAFLSLLLFWYRRHWFWLLPLYSGIAWAVLAKGPVGIALPSLAAVVLLALTWNSRAWQERRWRELCDWHILREFHCLRGFAFVVAVAGAWYVAATWVGGWAFFTKQILAENVFTFLDDPDWGGGHRHGPLYLPLQWFLGSLPWSLLWPVIGVSLWRQRRSVWDRSNPVSGLLVWTAVVFVFYELAASKRGVYLLAAYPAVALLTGWWWSEVALREESRSQVWCRAMAYGAYAVGAVLVVALAFIVVLGALAPSAASWKVVATSDQWNLVLTVARRLLAWPVVVCGLLCAGLWWWTGRVLEEASWSRGLKWLFLSMYVLMLLGRGWVFPAYAEQVTLRPFMDAVRRVAAGHPVYFWDTFDYQAVYYFYGRIPTLGKEEETPGPAFLLVDRGVWANPESALRRQYEEVQLDLDRGAGGTPRLVFVKRKVS